MLLWAGKPYMVNYKVNGMANVMVNHLLEGPEAKIQALGVLI
jgi:hypothetical protein